MAKILICEDIESSAQSLVEEAEKDSHTAVVLAKDLDREYVLKNIRRTVDLEQPDYMIIDGLNGRCFEAIDTAKKAKPDIAAILYTSSGDLIARAKDMGILAYCKKSQQELDNMFMYIIDCERDRRKNN